jgi:hypothetical protein
VTVLSVVGASRRVVHRAEWALRQNDGGEAALDESWTRDGAMELLCDVLFDALVLNTEDGRS